MPGPERCKSAEILRKSNDQNSSVEKSSSESPAPIQVRYKQENVLRHPHEKVFIVEIIQLHN